jgi:type IV secretory pathway VirB3-like protein
MGMTISAHGMRHFFGVLVYLINQLFVYLVIIIDMIFFVHPVCPARCETYQRIGN